MRTHKPPLTDRHVVLKCFARLCEYMYKKGAMDAAELYNPGLVQDFLDENDVKKNLRFVFDENSRNLKLEFYSSILSVYMIRLGAKKGAVILDKSRVEKNLQAGAAYLANAYYRKGLEDGMEIDLNEAKGLYYKDEKCLSHELVSGQKFDTIDFFQDMEMHALRLDGDDQGEGYRIWRFIGDALKEYYARRSKFDEY
jgi:hypothetical protein